MRPQGVGSRGQTAGFTSRPQQSAVPRSGEYSRAQAQIQVKIIKWLPTPAAGLSCSHIPDSDHSQNQMADEVPQEEKTSEAGGLVGDSWTSRQTGRVQWRLKFRELKILHRQEDNSRKSRDSAVRLLKDFIQERKAEMAVGLHPQWRARPMEVDREVRSW